MLRGIGSFLRITFQVAHIAIHAGFTPLPQNTLILVENPGAGKSANVKTKFRGFFPDELRKGSFVGGIHMLIF